MLAETGPLKPRWTFGVFYNWILNGLLTVYLLWLTVEMGVPVAEILLKKGVPQNRAAWQPLSELAVMALLPFSAASIANSAMRRLWELKPSAGVWQSFICTVVAASSFPWGTALFFPGLLLIWADFLTRKGPGASGKGRRSSAAGVVAGLLMAGALYTTQAVWIFDFPGGIEQIVKKVKKVAPTFKEEPAPVPVPAAPAPVVAPLPVVVKPQPPTHAFLLQSGKRLEGSAVREENNGYFLTIEGMGEVFFGKNEVAAVEPVKRPPPKQ